MSDRPTPETDANVYWPTSLDDSDNYAPNGRCVDADFARRLEHERDEAREIAKELRDAFERFYGFPNCSRARGLAQDALTKAKEVLG